MYLKSFNPEKTITPSKTKTYLRPEPTYIRADYLGTEKLIKKVALIAGCDAYVGRSTAVHFAREGAHLVIVCREKDQCARYTKYLVEAEGRACLLIKGDLRDPEFQQEVVEKVHKRFGTIDILVNNMAIDFPEDRQETRRLSELKTDLSKRSRAYLQFTTNLLPYLQKKGCIINTSALTDMAVIGHSKAAVTAFTELLAGRLILKNIRVNGVVAGLKTSHTSAYSGEGVPVNPAVQPATVGPVFVFLASDDAAFINGQVLQVNNQAVFTA